MPDDVIEHSDREAHIRNKLAPYLLDGTEAVEKIIIVLHSPSRPSDLRRTIASILRNTYHNTVDVDAVLEMLLEEIEQQKES